MQLKNSTGDHITAADNEIGSGGEAKVHEITSPRTNPRTNVKMVAKIFKRNLQEKQTKIKFMVANSPIETSPKDIQEAIVWPIEPLYNRATGDFVGYEMPYISETIPLANLTARPELGNIGGIDWGKFDFKKDRQSVENRLKICLNIANAVLELHKRDEYVLVDMKPDNIRINKDGHIAIIDLDSIQIATNNQIYNTDALTGEYAPPEHYRNINPKTSRIDKYWDYFSFAVISYQLLFLIHPFFGTHKDGWTRSEELIEHGCFANGRNSQEFTVIPPPHAAFNNLPRELQDLYKQCFDNGHDNPSERPDLTEWITAFRNILNPPPPVVDYFRQEVFPVHYRFCATLSWSAPKAILIHLNGQRVKATSTLNVRFDQSNIPFVLVAIDKSGGKDTQIIDLDLTVPNVTPLNRHVALNEHMPLNHHIALNEHMPLNHHIALNEHMPLNHHMALNKHMVLNHHIALNKHMPLNHHVALNKHMLLNHHMTLNKHIALNKYVPLIMEAQ